MLVYSATRTQTQIMNPATIAVNATAAGKKTPPPSAWVGLKRRAAFGIVVSENVPGRTSRGVVAGEGAEGVSEEPEGTGVVDVEAGGERVGEEEVARGNVSSSSCASAARMILESLIVSRLDGLRWLGRSPGSKGSRSIACLGCISCNSQGSAGSLAPTRPRRTFQMKWVT